MYTNTRLETIKNLHNEIRSLIQTEKSSYGRNKYDYAFKRQIVEIFQREWNKKLT